MRSKRPRFGLELSQDMGLGSLSQGMGGGLSQSQPGLGGSLGAGGGSLGGGGCMACSQEFLGRGGDSNGAADGLFRVPAPRGPMKGRGSSGGIPRAAPSPPCHRNAFLPSRDQPAETPAHARVGGAPTPAAALATMSRLRTDFVDVGVVGRGGFCKVFKVIGRLDGAQYAVKRTEKKLQTEREKLEALREVQAMASLGGGGEHVVRYFGAWMEYDHLYIQVRHA